jgi:DNA-binding transcriptional MocR family regulator
VSEPQVASGGRTAEVMRAIRGRIERRALTPGARLPSVRAMAQASGYSKSTVVEAYDRLAAEGVIRSRPGSGFFVATPMAPLSLAQIDPPLDEQIDPLWLLRQSLVVRPGLLTPGSGCLPDSWMAGEALRKGMRQAIPAAEDGRDDLSPPHGPESLRRLIVRRLLDQGIEASPDQVVLTDSCTQAIDLALRFLLCAGDTVVVDDPCYFNFLALLRAHRVKVVGVPYTPAGPDTTAFAAALAEHRPRLYLTNTAVHNPTGASLSAATAHRVLTLAERHDLVIVEDDIFAEFEWQPSARLAAFDGLRRVIRVGGYSKVLSNAVRSGHIAARPDWAAAIADLRIATGMTGSPLIGEITHASLTEPAYRRAMERLRVRLAKAMDQTARRLEDLGLRPWIRPQAGPLLWCELPGGLDATELARQAVGQGIVLAPGDAFSVSRSARSHLRFNVARMDDESVWRFLREACAGAARQSGSAPSSRRQIR